MPLKTTSISGLRPDDARNASRSKVSFISGSVGNRLSPKSLSSARASKPTPSLPEARASTESRKPSLRTKNNASSSGPSGKLVNVGRHSNFALTDRLEGSKPLTKSTIDAIVSVIAATSSSGSSALTSRSRSAFTAAGSGDVRMASSSWVTKPASVSSSPETAAVTAGRSLGLPSAINESSAACSASTASA